MPNGQKMPIDKETFCHGDDKQQREMLFDMISTLYEQSQDQAQRCSNRLAYCREEFAPKEESKKSKLYSVLGGIIGGVVFWASMISLSIGKLF